MADTRWGRFPWGGGPWGGELVPAAYTPKQLVDLELTTPEYRADDDIYVGDLIYNLIGTPGYAGFGVGICPPSKVPADLSPLYGFDQPGHPNHGNYLGNDGSTMVYIPKFYYRIAHVDNPTYATYGVNSIDVKGIDTYSTTATANANGYALHRAFIDGGGVEQDGVFVDKYQISKNAYGAGFVGSSIKNGAPISTASAHNPIADLTACSTNNYYQMINAAHARDGVDGAVNANSNYFCNSVFIRSALFILSLAHGQAAADATFAAWYDATYNFPKGCNNNALGDINDGSVLYTTDGYSNCGLTGSGIPFEKTTHNGQASGVADLNGLMWEVSIGITCIASGAAIEAITSAATPVFTWTGHGLSVGDYVMITSITQTDWTNFKSRIWKVASVPTADTFTLETAPDTSAYAAYDPVADGGVFYKGTFYIAKEATSMKDFTSGNSSATDHWGATGVAAMMDVFTLSFRTDYPNNGFAQRLGNGANQVFNEAISGPGWLLTGIGSPRDGNGISSSGTNLFGQDYFYQYIRNEACLLAGADWSNGASAGLGASYWSIARAGSGYNVGGRCACYPV